MKTWIVDASVGTKWFFEEVHQDRAIRLLERFRKGEIRLVVPEIFYVEMASMCWNRVDRRFIGVERALEVMDSVTGFSVERYPDHELADVAMTNALQFGITVYDELYVALSEIYVAPLVKADEQLLKVLSKRFDFICPLRDID